MLIKNTNAESIDQICFKNAKTKEEYAAIAHRLDSTDLVDQFYPRLPHVFTKVVNNVMTEEQLKNIIKFIIPRTSNSVIQKSLDAVSSENTHFNGNLNNVNDLAKFIKDSKFATNYQTFLQAIEENDPNFNSQCNLKFDWYGFRQLVLIYNVSDIGLNSNDLRMIKKILCIQNNFTLVEIAKTTHSNFSSQALEEQLLMDDHNIVYTTLDTRRSDLSETLNQHMLTNYGAVQTPN